MSMNALEDFSLRGKVVVLTGGAGLFGRGLTAMLAESGATLVLASRNVEKLDYVVRAERARGFDVHAESLDQGEEKSILALRDRVLSQHGRVDGLVNNAVLRTMKSPQDDVSTWELSMKVNSTGLMLITRAFGDAMAANSTGGSIVNIGSIQGAVGASLELYEGTDMGVPPPDYFFHKGGMMNLTRYHAAIYGSKNIRVNCLLPGGFFNHQPEPFLTRYNQHTMLDRMAGDRDLGGAVIFLLSDASRYITAAMIPVDGGYTAK